MGADEIGARLRLWGLILELPSPEGNEMLASWQSWQGHGSSSVTGLSPEPREDKEAFPVPVVSPPAPMPGAQDPAGRPYPGGHAGSKCLQARGCVPSPHILAQGPGGKGPRAAAPLQDHRSRMSLSLREPVR